MAQARRSMQELIGRRRRAGFVGRGDERAAFRQNLDLPPEDERHRFLFHIHGNAGVGKTFLVRELEQIARERGALTAYVDESVGSVPEAMAAMSREFAGQGHALKKFDRALAAYRERRHEAEAVVAGLEPEGSSPATATAVRAGLAGLGLIPGAGPFVGAVDPAQLAQYADRLRRGLSARFASQDDVQLVLSPEQVLTPKLLDELADLATALPWIVLFFDTYERIGPFVDTWLYEAMTSDRHGALPANVVVVTAGQRPFDTARWAGFADFMTDVPLSPFTEAEARGLLADRGVVAAPRRPGRHRRPQRHGRRALPEVGAGSGPAGRGTGLCAAPETGRRHLPGGGGATGGRDRGPVRLAAGLAVRQRARRSGAVPRRRTRLDAPPAAPV